MFLRDGYCIGKGKFGIEEMSLSMLEVIEDISCDWKL